MRHLGGASLSAQGNPWSYSLCSCFDSSVTSMAKCYVEWELLFEPYKNWKPWHFNAVFPETASAMKLRHFKKNLLQTETLFLHPLPHLISTGEKKPSAQYNKKLTSITRLSAADVYKQISTCTPPHEWTYYYEVVDSENDDQQSGSR